MEITTSRSKPFDRYRVRTKWCGHENYYGTLSGVSIEIPGRTEAVTVTILDRNGGGCEVWDHDDDSGPEEYHSYAMGVLAYNGIISAYLQMYGA